MVKRKRVYGPLESDRCSSVIAQFDDVMCNAVYKKVDLHDCVPFTRVRRKSTSGVSRLMQIFDAQCHKELPDVGTIAADNAGCGISLGSGTPIVVELRGTMLKYVFDYFRSRGFPDPEVKQKVESRNVWYGIVDGEHSHDAIVKLISLFERWKGYKWFVTVVEGGKSFER